MNAPAWLPVILAALMLVIAAYSLWRIVMSRLLEVPSDLGRDVVVFLLAVVTAGMLVHWMHVLRPGLWALLLAATGAWLTFRAAFLGGRPASEARAGGSTRLMLAAAAGCGIGVYMLLAGVAPSTINGSTAGYYTMAGMSDMYKDTTIAYPALGIVFALLLLGYAVATLDRISPSQGPVGAETGDTSIVRILAPRTLALCEVMIVLTMAYAIFAKLV